MTSLWRIMHLSGGRWYEWGFDSAYRDKADADQTADRLRLLYPCKLFAVVDNPYVLEHSEGIPINKEGHSPHA